MPQSPLLRLLIVEDSAEDAELLVRALRKGGYDVQYARVDSAESLRANLQESWDLVISDHSMPGFSGIAALEIVRQMRPEIPFIFVSGTIGEDVAVEAMRVGAQDYIMKGNVTRLVPAVARELREARNRAEQKRTTQRLRQLEKFEAIGKLAGGIAHDFNNVIGAIMGWAELGSAEVPEGSRARKFFEQIRAQSERAAGLTRQLLAYARRQTLEPRVIDLNQLVTETLALLQKAVGERVEMKISLAQDLPTTRADPSQIEQVLMNLCFNARDAMPEGGQLLIETRDAELDESYVVRHEYARTGRYASLSVSDTGTGISPDIIDRIFEPFFTTKEVGRGTGLGLATAYGIVKQHDGFIEVYSELGRGSIFKVYLPAATGTPAASPESAPDEMVRGGKETILLAEDHSGNLEMTDEILRKLGYRVISAKDGEEALQRFREHQNEVSLLLLDVIMPRMSGAQAYEEICASKPGMPVIFISGYSEESALLDSFSSRGAALLQKPFAPKVLARKIREILDKAAVQR